VTAVTAEAFLRTRPWVWRASLVPGVACALAAAVVFGSAPGAPLWSTMLDFLGGGMVLGVPILYQVRERSRALWPRQPSPRPAAPIHAPRPPAAGGAAVSAPRP
jgi:hypothetical protein